MSSQNESKKPPQGARSQPGRSLDQKAIDSIKSEMILGVASSHGGRGSELGRTAPRPRGRPAKARSASTSAPSLHPIDALYLRVGAEKQKVRQGDTISEMTIDEAILRQQAATALKGNSRAQADYLRSAAKARERRAAALAEENAFWRDYRDRTRAEIEEAKAAGLPEPQILPHPEDVVIEEGKTVRFIGPLDEAGVKRIEETCRLRDLMFLWEELDRRARSLEDHEISGAGLFLACLQSSLPPRLRLSDNEHFFRSLAAQRMPKRELLKALHAGWRSLGRPIKRGTLPLTLEVASRSLKSLVAIVSAFDSGELDPERISCGELDDHGVALLDQMGFNMA